MAPTNTVVEIKLCLRPLVCTRLFDLYTVVEIKLVSETVSFTLPEARCSLHCDLHADVLWQGESSWAHSAAHSLQYNSSHPFDRTKSPSSFGMYLPITLAEA
jgi:hypothetical protein